jgi:hypothetical protein
MYQTVHVSGVPFQPSVMQHSSLLGPFISYEEKENGPWGHIHNNSFLQLTNGPSKLECLFIASLSSQV